ncbi:MAG: ribonuclease III [Acidobacteriota bacterium]
MRTDDDLSGTDAVTRPPREEARVRFGRRLSPLEEQLGYRFRQPELIELAITHRSHANERGFSGNYERLEFLGDAVLGMVTADWLYRTLPDVPEGELSKLKSYLVSRPVLARRARFLGLGELMRLGVGEERSGGRSKDSLLADCMEAVLGAIYLDGGLEPVARLIRELLEDAMRFRRDRALIDAKTRLQELAQAEGWALPDYRLIEETGPDHSKTFTFECRLNGDRVGVGSGRSKKVAEQAAAAAALEIIEGPHALS